MRGSFWLVHGVRLGSKSRTSAPSLSLNLPSTPPHCPAPHPQLITGRRWTGPAERDVDMPPRAKATLWCKNRRNISPKSGLHCTNRSTYQTTRQTPLHRGSMSPQCVPPRLSLCGVLLASPREDPNPAEERPAMKVSQTRLHMAHFTPLERPRCRDSSKLYGRLQT